MKSTTAKSWKRDNDNNGIPDGQEDNNHGGSPDSSH